MTGRTHDLAAFTALTYIVATNPIPEISLSTGLIALSANFIGGLAPDIDQSTATLWRRIPAGGIWGKFLAPLLGGHRFISHSFFGVGLFGVGLWLLLDRVKDIFLVDMGIIWWAFMIGFVSHLLMDMITRDGVPWLFPLPINFGFPPLRALRMKTGGGIEKSIIFPALLLINIYIFYAYYGRFVEIIKNHIK